MLQSALVVVYVRLDGDDVRNDEEEARNKRGEAVLPKLLVLPTPPSGSWCPKMSSP